MDTGNPKSFRPLVDQLEAREVPAVTSVQLVNSLLTVQTNNIGTDASIVQNPFTVSIRDSGSNKVWNFPRNQVAVVQLWGGKGDDNFTSTGKAGVLVQMYGKGGNDTLDGDGEANLMIGGPGNDRIFGRGGDDTIYGGDGNDFIFGGIGNDILFGQDGDDNIIGGQGADRLTGAAGNDVLVTLDGTNRDIADAGTGTDTAWVDLINGVQEAVTGLDGLDFIRPVSAFANGADVTLTGDRIPDPQLLDPQSESYETFANRPLYSAAGPNINDVKQTEIDFGSTFSFIVLDDSWLLASLGSMVQEYPNLIKANVVDFGDGTFGVRFNGTFYRVDNDLPVATAGNVIPTYAGVGAQNSLWVAIVEKAAATATSNANPSYQLIDSTLVGGIAPKAAFDLFGGTTQAFTLPGGFATAEQLGIVLQQGVANNQAIVVSADATGATLDAGQSYSLTGLILAPDGTVSSVNLRNATATGGVNNDGYITLTIDDLFTTSGLLSFGDFNTV